MIERISLRTGIKASLLHVVETALAQNSRRSAVATHHQQQTVTPMRSPSRHRIEIERHPSLFDSAPHSRVGAGVDPRQWLLRNPLLASLVTAAIGDRWLVHIEDLQQLTAIADHPHFQAGWQQVKRANKQALATALYRSQGIELNIDTLFDLQLQPICGQQRQLLNLLHIITLFHRLKQDPQLDLVPRTFIFGHVGELAPDADLIMLIKSLATFLAADPDVRGKLQVVYVPQSAKLNYLMSCAADLTEEIAVAEIADPDLSKLKFAVNGTISIGSRGWANHLVEQAVGEDNYFSFGLAVAEISLFKTYGYDPYNYYKYYPEIQQAIDNLLLGTFTPTDPNACCPLINTLLGADEHTILADYVFYLTCQAEVSELYRQTSAWTRMSILNVAGVG